MLSQSKPELLKHRFNVVLHKLVLELQGKSCLSLDEVSAKKSLVVSKSFGRPQADYSAISEALAFFSAQVTRKLRKQKCKAKHVTVFLKTNRFRADLPQHHESCSMSLSYPTSDVRQVTHYAKQCLTKLYQKGYYYKKVGIQLSDIVENCHTQLDLFSNLSPEEQRKSKVLMAVMDKINHQHGHRVIKLAAEGKSNSWKPKSYLCSPAYTTNWQALPLVKTG